MAYAGADHYCNIAFSLRDSKKLASVLLCFTFSKLDSSICQFYTCVVFMYVFLSSSNKTV